MLVQPEKRMWVVYNHMPGGQVTAQKFDHVVRDRRKGDDMTERVVITCEEQIKGFEKSDFVALFLNGTLHKNKLLVYSGPEIPWKDPRAANKVLEWAYAKGVTAKTPAPKAGQSAQADPQVSGRIDGLEGRIGVMEQKQAEDGVKIEKILEAVTNGGGKK